MCGGGCLVQPRQRKGCLSGVLFGVCCLLCVCVCCCLLCVLFAVCCARARRTVGSRALTTLLYVRMLSSPMKLPLLRAVRESPTLVFLSVCVLVVWVGVGVVCVVVVLCGVCHHVCVLRLEW